MSAADWAIDIDDISKSYNRKVHALRGVGMKVGRGEIFGLLGPNGAGKSTLVKIMMTVVLPDRGGGLILGEPLGHKPALRRVGYLPEGHRFAPYLTGQQTLDFCGRLSLLPRAKRSERSRYWLERLGMLKWAGTRIGQYSKGMVQRIGVAQALLHDPELVLLDEPTDGVDPLGRREIREILLELKRAGKTVFINSHILSELEMVCDRVAILVHGRVARQGQISELTAHSLTYRVTAATPCPPDDPELKQLGAAVQDRHITIRGHDAGAVNKIIDLLRSRNIIIESVQPVRWSLEEVFIDAASQLESQE